MLCFRCGSPVEPDAAQCPNCGQDLMEGAAADTESFADLHKQLRKGERDRGQPNTYRVGEVVRERYEITDLLGRGPLGVVYKALDQEVEVDVALKVVDRETMTSEAERETFLETIGRLRQVVHNNVVRYFDVDRDGDRCFYVTQFLEGLTLRKIIDLRKEKGQRFSLSEVEPICSQLCDALATDEAVHGGLKPDNVIILPDLLKVTDFALADALPRDAYLSAQREAGSAYAYLAPEVQDGGGYNERADVFSIAVIVTELLSGQIHQGARISLHALDAEIPEALDEVLGRALSAKPSLRQRNARELGDALLAVLGGEEAARSTARYGSGGSKTDAATQPDEGDAPEGAAVREAGVRSTLRFGSGAAEPALFDERARPRTLGYGESTDGRRVAARVAAAAAETSSARGAKPKNEREVTQQLSLDDVEDLDDEAALAADAAAASAVVERKLLAERKPPAEGTQTLSLEDVEFAEESARQSPPEDDGATVPRMTMEEAMGPQPGSELDEALFPASREAAQLGDKTQQIDPEMIVDHEDEPEPEQLVLVPPEALRDSASVSGETDSTVKPLRDLRRDEPVLPKKSRRRAITEARARDVLSAFDAADESGVRDMPEATPVPEPREQREPTGRRKRTPVVTAVAPEVLHEDAVPEPLDTTLAIERPLPAPVPGRRQSTRRPVIIACILGLLVGTTMAIAYSLMQRDADKQADLERKRQQLAARKPPPPSTPDVKPAVVPAPKTLALTTPLVQPVDAGRPDDTVRSDAGTRPDTTTAVARTPDPSKPDAGKPARKVTTPTKVAVVKRDPIKRDPIKRDPIKRDPIKRDPIKRDPIKRDPRKVVKGHKKPKIDEPGLAKGDPKKAGSNKCYAGMVHVKAGGDGYCIDRYEAPGRGQLPKRGVSLGTARGACRARGLRLCSAREWMRACAGLFPYGRQYDGQRCNTGGTGVVAAGSKRGCRSRWGVYDLSGNVSEWVEGGSAMGGYYASAQGHASCMARGSGGPHTGYRCCGDPSWE